MIRKKWLAVPPAVLVLAVGATVAFEPARPAYASTVAFAGAVAYPTGANPYYVDTADINNDGYLDLLSADFNSAGVTVLLGTGSGTFAAATPVPTPAQPGALALGDFNGDARTDLAVTTAGNTASIYLGNGDATFLALTSIAVGGAGFVSTADFNGDAAVDLAVADGGANAAVSILLGYGDGTFQPPVRYATSYFTRNALPIDLNHDSAVDLVVPSAYTNTVGVLLGNGDGTFAPRYDVTTGAFPFWAESGDLNHDGHADLAVSDATGNAVSVLLGHGDGTFATHVDYPVGAGPDTVRLADFTGDGHLDVAVANDAGASVSVLVGNGNGTLQSQQVFAAGLRSFGLTAGDFSGDGRPDLATSNYDEATISVLINETTASPSPMLTGLSPGEIWVGLKNSDAVGLKLDLRAELYVDANLVSAGQLDSFPGGSSGFAHAHLAQIPFASFPPVPVPAGAVIGLTLYVRNACTGSGPNSGVARLWFNDIAADSRTGLVVDTTTTSYYLQDGYQLLASPGAGPKKTVDVSAGSKCSPFKAFGTWTTTL